MKFPFIGPGVAQIARKMHYFSLLKINLNEKKITLLINAKLIMTRLESRKSRTWAWRVRNAVLFPFDFVPKQMPRAINLLDILYDSFLFFAFFFF